MRMTQAISNIPIGRESTALRRIVGAIVFVVAASLVGTAAWLSPAADGHGTHEQLGLPPCSMMMFTGRPCPTCGYTTAFSHVAHGHLIEAAIVQPVGMLLALAIIAAGLGGGYVMVTGSDIAGRLRPLVQLRTLVILGLVIAAGWAYKLLTVS
jgi:hypothetical protein